MTAMPFRFSSSVRARSESTSCRVSEAVGSSMMTSLASAASARQIATICRLAMDSSESFCSRSSLTSINSMAAAATRRIAAQLTRCTAPPCWPMAMFSGHRQMGEERQVLVDHLDAVRAALHRREMGVAPTLDDDPAARIGRLDPGDDFDHRRLADPLPPTRQWISPGSSSKSTFDKARTPPNRFDTPRSSRKFMWSHPLPVASVGVARRTQALGVRGPFSRGRRWCSC